MDINGSSNGLNAAVMVLVGLGLVGYGGYSHMVASASVSSSIMVDGTVESVSVDRDLSSRGTDYRPEISFSFSYNGSEYTGDRIYPSGITPGYDSRLEAEDEIEDYEEGQNVTVYLKPGSEDQAYLRNESTNRPLLMMAAGALFALFGIGYSIFKNLPGVLSSD